MHTDTARHYAEKVRDALKAIEEADVRNLDALTAKVFNSATHEIAAREARGLRASLLLHAANLAEAVLAEAERPTEPRFSLEEMHEAMQDAGRDMKGDDGPADFREYVAAHLSALRAASAPVIRCGAEFAGHVCGLLKDHAGQHEDTRTLQRWPSEQCGTTHGWYGCRLHAGHDGMHRDATFHW